MPPNAIVHERQALAILRPHGISIAHANAFLQVADLNKCIIIIRSPGPLVYTLLHEIYASKGYHNKAKTCNWGPMAGFVMANAAFSKQSLTGKGKEKQEQYLYEARVAGCRSIPLKISMDRYNELRLAKVITQITNVNNNPNGMTCKATLKEYGGKKTLKGDDDLIQAAKKYIFILRWDNNTNVYNVFYKKDINSQQEFSAMAIVDSRYYQNNAPPITYKMATTGDYDLFAVWKRIAKINYESNKNLPNTQANNIHNQDARPVNANDARQGINLQNEDPNLGNVKPLISLTIKPRLNQAIRNTGYDIGPMIHHSDEAGRPNISNIDFPVIAFLPPHTFKAATQFVVINGMKDLFEFYFDIEKRFHIDLNKGWIEAIDKYGNVNNKPKLVRAMTQQVISS